MTMGGATGPSGVSEAYTEQGIMGNFKQTKNMWVFFLIKCIYVVNYLCEPSRQK